MAHSGLLGLAVLLLWSGVCCAVSYPNLKCCCKTYMHNGSITDNTTQLTCYPGCSFRSIPKPLPPSLAKFMLWHQNIAELTTGDFPPLESLTMLAIKWSQVVSIQPGSFQNLSSLSKLQIFGNKISRLEAETFKGLAKLQILDLDDNRIRYVDDAAFAGLAGLRKLSLSKNCLSSIPRGTSQSPRQSLELTMTWNPITSFTGVEELKHILRLVLAQNGIPCDCKLREMKEWMYINKHLQWTIACVDPVTGLYKRIRWLSMNDLKCAYDVTLSGHSGAGNVSFTCQTDCHEGLDLTFSWIAPNGDRCSSSHEYSRTYTDVRESSCKGSVVTRHETRRTCYSVLDIPALGYGMDGTYTCLVTSRHSKDASAFAVLTAAAFPSERQTATHGASTITYTNVSQPLTTSRYATNKSVETESAARPGPKWSAIDLILVGVTSFVGCSVIVGVIAACVGKCKGARQQHSADRQRNAAAENTDQFSGTNSARGVTGENSDQFSDTDGAIGCICENNDQFADIEGDEESLYENDDQFSHTKGGQNENDNQLSDDDDMSKHSPRTIPHKQTREKPGATYFLAKAEKAVQLRNRGIMARAKSNRRKIRGKVLTVLAEVHAQAQASGHYDNKNATSSSNAGASDSGHYDNERPMPDPVTTASEAPKRSDDGSDSDQDYMTLPNQSPEDTGVGEQSKQHESKHGDRNTSNASTSASADCASDNDYVTFPGEENADKQQRGAEKKEGQTTDIASFYAENDSDHIYMTLPQTDYQNGQMSDLDTVVSNAEDNSDHTYVTLPQTECQNGQLSDLDTVVSNADDNSDHTYVTLPQTECQNGQLSDLDTVVSNAEENSDHTYVTLPQTECQNGQLSDLDTVVSNADDDSDHTYVTLPQTDYQNGQLSDLDTVVSNADDDSNHTYVTFPETERQNGQVSDLDTVVSNAEDNYDHTYVTLPQTECQNGQVSDLDTVVSNAEDNSDHTYVIFPETECQNGQVSDLDTAVSNAEDNSDHTYVAFPETERQNGQMSDLDTVVSSAEENSDHTYVTFPKTERQNGQLSDLDTAVSNAEDNSDHTSDTAVSNAEDNSDHTYVTFPKTECQNGQVSDLDTAVSNADDNSDHIYVTFPKTERQNGQVSDLDTVVSNVEDISDHTYVTLPQTDYQNGQLSNLDTVVLCQTQRTTLIIPM
ncbi:SLIT3 [Branchiostoma lanceolatum]|uniref:SLIT3 protein n=1 Tax=Branchiostoma lanceolatum TaxID=7740 RepID=A0A8J9Z153_BRALA|nr:SLIT3 [Branchiostoma lanceolatum]